MKVTIFRNKMIGGGFSYDALVRTEEASVAANENIRHLVIRDVEQWFRFSDACQPDEYWLMTPGEARYTAYEVNRIRAGAELFEMAQAVYPELQQVDKHQLPSILAMLNVPDDDDGESDTREVEWEVAT